MTQKRYVRDEIRHLENVKSWLERSVSAGPGFIAKYEEAYGNMDKEREELAAQRTRLAYVKIELAELRKIPNRKNSPWTSSRILITNHTDTTESFEVIGHGGKIYPGGVDVVPACLVIVLIESDIKEHVAIKHDRSFIPPRPDYDSIDKQAAEFQKMYPGLGIQDNLRRRGVNWPEICINMTKT